jgi:DNA polymerase III epsilon subunit-like protein
MRHLFFDTETAGFNGPIMQIAWMVTDSYGEEIESRCVYVRQPFAYELNEKAFEIHGITKAQADKGFLAGFVMDLFEIATYDNKIIGHNVAFDLRMVALNRERLEMPAYNFGEGICTMKAAKAAKIPASLGALHQHLFGCGFESAHDALADVKATARCFFELRQLNLI